MMLSLIVSTIWLLAMMATAAHAQQGNRSFGALAQAGLAFALVLAVSFFLSPQPNWIGVLVGLSAMWQLIGGPLPRAGALLAGACAALGAALQIAAGLAAWIAVPLAAVALLAAMFALGPLAPRPGLRDLALIAVALGAPVAGLISDLVYGWHSAAVLNRGLVEQTDIAAPAWAIAIVILALVAGAFRGIWNRK